MWHISCLLLCCPNHYSKPQNLLAVSWTCIHFDYSMTCKQQFYYVESACVYPWWVFFFFDFKFSLFSHPLTPMVVWGGLYITHLPHSITFPLYFYNYILLLYRMRMCIWRIWLGDNFQELVLSSSWVLGFELRFGWQSLYLLSTLPHATFFFYFSLKSKCTVK